MGKTVDARVTTTAEIDWDGVKAPSQAAFEVLAQAADELALDPAPARFDACAQGFAALDRAVRSHFRYEEDEIGPALGFYEVQV